MDSTAKLTSLCTFPEAREACEESNYSTILQLYGALNFPFFVMEFMGAPGL